MLSGVLASCAGGQPGQAPRIPPRTACPHVPAPRAELKPPHPTSPLPQMLQPGHWEWDTSGYVWQPAHWQTQLSKHPPHWLDGFWVSEGGACVWHNGQYVYGGAGRGI